MAKIIHFDIAADDPERAKAFYKHVFGWEFSKAPGVSAYWLIKTGGDKEHGIGGGMAQRDAPWQHITCFVDVASLADTLEKLTGAGGKIIQPRTVIPGVGFIAAAEDTEGNVIGIIERSVTAGF